MSRDGYLCVVCADVSSFVKAGTLQFVDILMEERKRLCTRHPGLLHHSHFS